MAALNYSLAVGGQDRPNVFDGGVKVEVRLKATNENASPGNPQKLISKISKAD